MYTRDSHRFRRQLGLLYQERLADARVFVAGGGPVLPHLLMNLALLGFGKGAGEIRLGQKETLGPEDLGGQFMWPASAEGVSLFEASLAALEGLVGQIGLTEGADASGCDLAIELEPGAIESARVPVLKGCVSRFGFAGGSGEWGQLRPFDGRNLFTPSLACCCGAWLAQEAVRILGLFRPFEVERAALVLEMKLPSMREGDEVGVALDGVGQAAGLVVSEEAHPEGGRVLRVTVPPEFDATWQLFERVDLRHGPYPGHLRQPRSLTYHSPFAGMTYEREADQPSVAPQIVTGGGAILVGGLGGLGTWIAGLLAVSGLEAREVLLCDFDRVEEHNLNRQVLYGAEDVGRLKAVSAASRLSKWSPGNTWTPITERISPSFLLENESKLRDIAVTITGFDNAHARMLLGMAAAEAGRLHVDSGGGLLDGNVNLYQPGTDCILCLWSRVNGGVEKAWRLAQDPGAAHCQEDDAASSRLAGAIVTTSAIVASLATVVALGSIANGPQVAHQHFYRARPNDFGSCPGRTGDAGPCLVHRHAIQHEELAGLFRSLLADTSNRLAEF